VALGLLLLARQAISDPALPPVGARASALGGAFTAVANDSTAFFWNPAGLVYGRLLRAGFYGGNVFQDRGELVNRLRSEQPGDHSTLEGDETLGFSVSFAMLGVAITDSTQTASFLQEDILVSRGLESLDVALTFVQSLPVDELTIGGNVRFIRGTAFESATQAKDVPTDERNVKDLVNAATASDGRSESELGLDLGILYQPTEWVRLGLTGRNLNEPTFHTETGTEIVLHRQTRAGVAFFFEPGYAVAVDLDLTARQVAGGGDSWRELAIGAEKSWRRGRIAIRGGLRTEAAGGRLERPGFSLGVGLGVSKVVVEVGAMTSTERRQGAVWLGVTLSR
jgi:hypothetical protein